MANKVAERYDRDPHYRFFHDRVSNLMAECLKHDIQELNTLKHKHIAVYKALYQGFGGFAADVVAAIDQAAQDGVDIISLSITPNRRL
ncbi:hypothetical protein ACFX11_036511 [Malus domestica]